MLDYASRLKSWKNHGFPELGDHVGMGIGSTTMTVLQHKDYNDKPHEVITLSSGRLV